jgi:sulfate/thiosulfate transport system permease protein
MAAIATAAMGFRRPSVIPGFGAALGLTVTYLSLIVLIPLAGMILKSATLGWPELWRIASDPRTALLHGSDQVA